MREICILGFLVAVFIVANKVRGYTKWDTNNDILFNFKNFDTGYYIDEP